MSFETVDEPATYAEIDRWWNRLGVVLVGFTAAGFEGPDGIVHWVAVTTSAAERVMLYRLCWTLDDDLPWERTPEMGVNCMTCLVYAAKPDWKEPT